MTSSATDISLTRTSAAESDSTTLPPSLMRVLLTSALILALVVWVFVMLAFRGQPGDDPYITYRYAENIAAGRGFVFNAGERVQSTTTPLYALLLAAGGLSGLDIPALGYWLSGICLLALAACMALLARDTARLYTFAGLLAAVLTFLHPVTTYGLGTEMPLLMALSWGSWFAVSRDAWNAAALLAALAAVTRGDGVLVGVALGIVCVWTHRSVPVKRWRWSAVAIYLVVVAPWYIFAWLYFGSPLPATLGAKLAQGSTPGTVSFFEGLGFFWTRSLVNSPFIWFVALVLVIVGVVALARTGWRMLVPLVWAALFMVGFSVLHVPRYPWYYSPLVPVTMLALLFGAGMLTSLLARSERRRVLAWLGGVGVAALLAGAIYASEDVQARRPTPAPHALLYIEVGRWLKANTPPGASVGAEEVGLLGYYADRRIIDFVGLIEPAVAPHRARGDNLWAVQTYKPDYIVALPAWLASVGSNPEVASRYSTVRAFDEAGGDRVTLLKRTRH